MVLLVHGGPWGRDYYGYDGEVQWLANRGYAVLQVNFRGSTGFGKDFTNAGNGEWGRKMHDDLIDAVHWAVTAERLDHDQGRDHGRKLWRLRDAGRPDVHAGRVRMRRRHRRAIEPQHAAGSRCRRTGRSFFEQLAKRVGDPRTEDGKKWLTERSPLDSGRPDQASRC